VLPRVHMSCARAQQGSSRHAVSVHAAKPRPACGVRRARLYVLDSSSSRRRTCGRAGGVRSATDLVGGAPASARSVAAAARPHMGTLLTGGGGGPRWSLGFARAPAACGVRQHVRRAPGVVCFGVGPVRSGGASFGSARFVHRHRVCACTVPEAAGVGLGVVRDRVTGWSFATAGGAVLAHFGTPRAVLSRPRPFHHGRGRVRVITVGRFITAGAVSSDVTVGRVVTKNL